jgi:hypothetical protein
MSDTAVDTPTWQELLPVITGSMPRGSDPDGSIARNIALGLELHLEFRSRARTVAERAAEIIREHIIVDGKGGIANPCACGVGDLGGTQSEHVVQLLDDAGLLADDPEAKP